MLDVIGGKNSNEKVLTSAIERPKNIRRLFLIGLVLLVILIVIGAVSYWRMRVSDLPVVYRGEIVDIQITQKTIGIIPEEEMKKTTLNTVSVKVNNKKIEFGMNPEMVVEKVNYGNNIEKLGSLSWDDLKIGDKIVLVMKNGFKDVEVISPEFIEYIGVEQK